MKKENRKNHSKNFVLYNHGQKIKITFQKTETNFLKSAKNTSRDIVSGVVTIHIPMKNVKYTQKKQYVLHCAARVTRVFTKRVAENGQKSHK